MFPQFEDRVRYEANGQGGGAVTAQAPAGAQGGGASEAQPSSGDSFNWGLFPDVPEDQRSLLQPHLKQVLGHVTQLEQKYAPLKGFVEAGLSADQVEGLMGFAQSFDHDPVSTWVQLGKNLQEGGELTGDIDFAEVDQIIAGEPASVDPAAAAGEGDIATDPKIAALEQQIAEMRQRDEDREVNRRQAIEDRLFKETLSKMRNNLQEAGFPEVSDNLLTGSLIAHRGDADQALQALTGIRDGSLKKVTQDAQNRDLELPNGAPPAPPKPTTRRDQWGEASAKAANFLKGAQAAGAQE